MISQKCFQKEWLVKIKAEKYRDVDIALLERTIYAFELLGLLSMTKKDFIFKGGTALILLLPELKRLSIDIDILGKFDDNTYKSVITNSVFTRYQIDDRINKNIPKQHVKFFYNSQLDKKEKYILLDLLNEENPYSSLKTKIIHSVLFEVDEDVKVKIPYINDLLADKFTAFAPNTIGILYGTDKSMEIIKQLFDISILFDSIIDLENILSTYSNIYTQQNSYRGSKFTIAEVLMDSFVAASKICMLDLKGSVEDNATEELRSGIKGINNFLLSRNYNLSNAKVSAAKIALLSSILLFKKTNFSINNFKFGPERVASLKSFELPKEFKPLNTLKKINVESFYYWSLITKITDRYDWMNIG
ncbi:MAG: hypothetical protein FD143_95 [Ignavibacteria bacterium]|nr:MAG: hypothetical protein FD143_95 [Ignavibacteria bacterium]KAF0162490.1 MAG: hypothetical protein FD188_93 [Ignavibacteria bacterium]